MKLCLRSEKYHPQILPFVTNWQLRNILYTSSTDATVEVKLGTGVTGTGKVQGVCHAVN
jgi:hypothetical protein